MTAFLPPETNEFLRKLSARNERRARRVVITLRPAAAGRRSGVGDPLRALQETLGHLRGSRRSDLMCEPGMRAWLAAAEEAAELSDPRLTDDQVFDHLARGRYLAEAMPAGRIDARFRARVSKLGARLAERALRELPPLLAFRTPENRRYGPFKLDLAPEGETARAAGEVQFFHPAPATLRLPQGTGMELVRGGVRVTRAGGRAFDIQPRWVPLETIPGSEIVLTRRVISSRRGLRAGPRLPGAAARLARALALLSDAWPHAHCEVLAHTRTVVPVLERGTVSWSYPDRPGVSYINLEGKTLVDLADDLLHESAHHRLHGLEELSPLIVKGTIAGADADEPRYWSAWRRSLRPLRGILHAAYTFAWRAELLLRLRRLPGRLPRVWMRNELVFEKAALERAVADLADARRRGLLTTAGAQVARAVASRVREMSK